jgi:hypothetical protein
LGHDGLGQHGKLQLTATLVVAIMTEYFPVRPSSGLTKVPA